MLYTGTNKGTDRRNIMSKHNKYILVRWYMADGGDHADYFEEELNFVTSKQLDDITQLMKDFDIKQWVKDPETITEKNFKYGDGSLVEYRNLTIKPVKIVESWSYTSEVAL